MVKISKIVQKIWRCVQDNNTQPQKPRRLPICTMEQIEEFQNADEESYSQVVNYLHYVGGFSLKEALQLCLKEALSDELTRFFTWFGREPGRHPFYNTRLAKAIYDAVCKNRHFHKPTRLEFQKHMQEALRVTKERLRQRTRPRGRNAGQQRNPWNDESEEEILDEKNNEQE
ncbi:uncharacterized protein LOC116853658 [Odontomachus brunneus]|uniref:uncharacterized protein LOC116853658 n=1 Tax=Odontomachus brunneus TaxID=486640 RepID=UPI0013F29951|nr:uncharacterized protein LOC116853658 [Odontomachus brunneus]